MGERMGNLDSNVTFKTSQTCRLSPCRNHARSISAMYNKDASRFRPWPPDDLPHINGRRTWEALGSSDNSVKGEESNVNQEEKWRCVPPNQ
ncbi:hypothetical protein SESBI_38038 [Sesbania bispinosa]|nr:hypothetical protein SESBI_38038 [Sesbania bispinosa]